MNGELLRKAKSKTNLDRSVSFVSCELRQTRHQPSIEARSFMSAMLDFISLNGNGTEGGYEFFENYCKKLQRYIAL